MVKNKIKPIHEYVPLKGANLLRRFSILAFIPIIIVVAALGSLASYLLVDSLVVSESEHVNIHTTVFANKFLTADDFDPDYPAEKNNFESALSPILESSEEYIRMEVFDKSGTVLWSDKKELVGINFYESNPELREALTGKVATHFGSFSIKEEHPSGMGLEVYVPILKTGKVVGVIETYRVPSKLFARIRNALIFTWLTALLGGILIYFSLYWLVKSSYLNQISLENKIRLSKKRLENLIDGIKDGVALLDPDCNILTINDRLAGMLKISIKEAIGQNVIKLIFKDVKEKMFSACENTCIKKQESEFDFTIYDRDSGKELYLQVNFFPLTLVPYDNDESGNEPPHSIMVIRDITKEKELIENLLRSEKLAIIGTLFPKISHEIRNPLNAIQLGLETLQEKYPSDSIIDLIVSSKEKLLSISNDLLAFSRIRDDQFEFININESLQNAIRFLKETTGQIKFHRIVEDYHKMPLMRGIPGKLEQLFINLIINSSQAMEGIPLYDQVLSIGTFKDDDGSIVAFVKDSGKGIKKEDHDKIFDPFYTTKAEGKGTGLGMAIVKEIANNHSASISFESGDKKGTTFYIRFKAANEKDFQMLSN